MIVFMIMQYHTIHDLPRRKRLETLEVGPRWQRGCGIELKL